VVHHLIPESECALSVSYNNTAVEQTLFLVRKGRRTPRHCIYSCTQPSLISYYEFLNHYSKKVSKASTQASNLEKPT
jgi:hypothetical protein